MVRACGTQKSSPLGRQQHRCVDPGEIFTPEMGSESSPAHPLPHPSHMHTLHRKPPNAVTLVVCLEGILHWREALADFPG